MVQEHIGRAGLVRIREVADHAFETEHTLERFAFEPGIEVIADGAHHQLPQYHLVLAAQAPQGIAALEQRQRIAPAAAEIGRCFHGKGPQRPGHGTDLVLEGLKALCVSAGEARYRGPRLLAVPGQLQVVAVENTERARGPLHDLEAMLFQRQVSDHLRVQQTDGVGVDRVAKAGVELLCYRRATNPVPGLEDSNLEAGSRQVASADQAVMARPNDDDIRLPAHANNSPAPRFFAPV